MKTKNERNLKRQELLNEIVVNNLKPIILNGHKDCDEAYGIWLTSDRRFTRFTLGEVRRAKEQMQIECE